MQLVIGRFNQEISWESVKRVKMVKKPMKTDINGHGRSQTVIDGEKRWAKNGNGESRSA